MRVPKLLAVLAHPDDESLGFGGTLAKYASEGVEVSLLTATRGDAGRFHGLPQSDPKHPGRVELAKIREGELRAAASALGILDVRCLDYPDQHLDEAEPRAVIGELANHIRRVQPDVVITFGPDGAYGHPDHIAISQYTAAALVTVAPLSVSKFYYLAWPATTWAAYENALKKPVSLVDGVERHATPWPEWAITTSIDTRTVWPAVWRAVSCHQSQVAAYGRLKDLSPEHHEALWGSQSYYRVFSTVNGGRARETDLFEGIR